MLLSLVEVPPPHPPQATERYNAKYFPRSEFLCKLGFLIANIRLQKPGTVDGWFLPRHLPFTSASGRSIPSRFSRIRSLPCMARTAPCGHSRKLVTFFPWPLLFLESPPRYLARGSKE